MSVLSFSEKVIESYMGKELLLADSLGKWSFSFAESSESKQILLGLQKDRSPPNQTCPQAPHYCLHQDSLCSPRNVHSSMLKHCWSWYSSCDCANCTWEPHKGHPASELSMRIYLGRGNLGFFICRVQEFELFPLTVAIICPVKDSFLW